MLLVPAVIDGGAALAVRLREEHRGFISLERFFLAVVFVSFVKIIKHRRKRRRKRGRKRTGKRRRRADIGNRTMRGMRRTRTVQNSEGGGGEKKEDVLK